MEEERSHPLLLMKIRTVVIVVAEEEMSPQTQVEDWEGVNPSEDRITPQ